MKSFLIIALVAVTMIGVMVPSVFAQQSETTITLESFKPSISLLYETNILLSGQLLNENGSPLSGKEVWVWGNSDTGRGQGKSTTTDSNGKFTIDYDNLNVNYVGTWTIYTEFEGDLEYMQSSSNPRQLKMTLPVPDDTNKLDWSLIFVTSKKECSFEDEESKKFYARLTDDYLKQYNLLSNDQMVRCISHDVMSDVINIYSDKVDLFIVIPDYDLSVKDRHTTGSLGHYSNWKINTIVSQHLSQSVEDRDSAWTLSHELAHFVVDWKGYSWDIVGDSVHTIQDSYNTCRYEVDTTLTHCPHLYDTVRTPSGNDFPVMDANYVMQTAESMVVPKYTPPPTPKPEPTPKPTPKPEPTPDPVTVYPNTITTVDESGFSQACVATGCYTPLTTVVNYGDVVTMTNTDQTGVHSFTSGTVDRFTPQPDGNFDSGVLMSGDSFQWQADIHGPVPYYCMLHSWMVGTILVDSQPVVEPTLQPILQSDVKLKVGNSSYKSGDIIFYSGKITNAKVGSTMTITLTSPNGDLVAVEQLSVGVDGKFRSFFSTEGSLWGTNGMYTIHVQHASSQDSVQFKFKNMSEKTHSDHDTYVISESDIIEKEKQSKQAEQQSKIAQLEAEMESQQSKIAQLEAEKQQSKIAQLEAEMESQQSKIAQLEAEQSGGGCLIATATYGSELAPQVQQLRELRDNQLLQTESGTAFMGTFNDIYYSFSPVIADYERENPYFKEAVKLAITPMISSLSLMENAETESEVLGIGISVIALNLGMYLGIPAIVIVGIKKRF